MGYTSSIFAACKQAAYCDAPPGECAQTCNGGGGCWIGSWYWMCYPKGETLPPGACGVDCTPDDDVHWDWCCTGGTPVDPVENCTCSTTGGSCSDEGTACGGPTYDGVCECETTGDNGGGGGPIDGGCTGDCGCSGPDCDACTPSCTAPYCGQPDGCGGTCGTSDVSDNCGVAPNRCGGTSICGASCSDADDGAPDGAPTNLSPADGENATLVSGHVTLSWTSPSALADQFDLEVAPASDLDCTATGGTCQPDLTGTSYNFTVTNGIYAYAYRVRAANTSCGDQPGPWSPWTHFNLVDTISGTFYLGNGVPSGGVCINGGSAVVGSPGGGAAISNVGVDGGTQNGIITGTTYSIQAYVWNPGNNIVTLTPGLAPNGEPYACACPTGCSISGINSPGTNVNFFLIENKFSNGGWWQTRGGNAYAAQASTVAMRSYVPTFYCTALEGCIPYVLATDLDTSVDSAGIAMTGGGAVDTTKDAGNSTAQTTERTTQVAAIGTSNTRLRENYDFFYREFSLGTNPTDDFSTTATDAQKPAGPPSDGKAAYFHEGDLQIQSRWQVNAGEKMTIFVTGNLLLTDPDDLGQLITVEPGGFLSFVVKGDVIADPTVGNSVLTDTTTNIEGVYIADGYIITQSVNTLGTGDKRFVAAGTYVGWSGIQLERDFDDGNGAEAKEENNTKPVESFIFRPDFVINVPEQMNRSSYIWQETN